MLDTRSRTYRFAVLGMALANQFEVKEPQDYLRGLSNVLLEYELLKEDSDRPKMVRVALLPHYTRAIDVLAAIIPNEGL